MATTPNTPDPFTAMGGGVYQNGGWKPRNMFSADQLAAYDAEQGGPTQPAQPPPQPAAQPQPTAPGAPGPGWVQYGNGGWAPPDHPIATNPPPSAGPAQPPPSAGPANPPGTPTTPGGPTTPQGQPLATNAAQISQPFYQTLHSILSQTNPVTGDDPQIKNALNASRAQEERNFAKTRAMMAERGAAEGTNMSGGFNAQLANARAGIGARQGQLAADMVRELQTERMGQIMTALSIGQGLMSEGDRNILQRELAQLDAALRREGMALEGSEGAAERALRASEGEAGRGLTSSEGSKERALREALAGMQQDFNFAQLNQQGDQFQQNLSANVGMQEAQLAQALMLALLGGD